MGKPCSVCAHSQRGEIDRRLAWQVVNLTTLADDFGLKRDALRRHRARHLPTFLPAFAAKAAGLSNEQLSAEAERLYLVTLDALAQAEAGVLTNVATDDKGHVVESRRVSSSAVARLIREARAGLDLLTKLSAAGDDAPRGDTPTRDAALEARLLAALDRVNERAQLPPAEVLDVEVVASGLEDADLRAPLPPTPGPSPGSGPVMPREGEAPFSQGHHPENREHETDIEATQLPDGEPNPMSDTSWRTPKWTGNPAASPEERAHDRVSPIPITRPNQGEPGSHRRSER